MEHYHVNTEATSIESGSSYCGRSARNPSTVRESAKEETAVQSRQGNGGMVQAEVSRGRSTVGYEPHKAWRPHKRPEGLND